MGAAQRALEEKRDKRRAASAAKGREGALWRGFINVALTDDQKSQFEAWARTDEPWDVLEQACLEGVAFGVKLDTAGSAYMASATQRTAGHVNCGLCVTARAGEPGRALFRVLFLLAVVGVSADWEATQPLADPDRW